MIRSNLVENQTTEKFSYNAFRRIPREAAMWKFLRVSLRLIVGSRSIKSLPRSFPTSHIFNVIVHRFEETIGGRLYHIEVTAVRNRWRAQLRRTPGVPTAMMPFYGETPAEAARQLAQWLALAHKRLTGTPTGAQSSS